MAREITEVIDKLLKEIPDSHAVVSTIQGIRDSALYSAPENMGLRWRQLCNALEFHFKYPPVEDYEKKILAIITDKEGG